jgi:hypothetical protein
MQTSSQIDQIDTERMNQLQTLYFLFMRRIREGESGGATATR